MVEARCYHDRPPTTLIFCVHRYHQAARPCLQGHLHGVSHNLASPMPTNAFVSVSPIDFRLTMLWK